MATSSECGSIGSDEMQGKASADEAQTCYNILLILRTDTQHLISLRNGNLTLLENKSGLDEDAASSRTALLACINESIIAATRSIKQLGPFLDRHRWPAASGPAYTPASQRRSFTISFKPHRQRRKSKPESATSPCRTLEVESTISPDELFSWTLALTAQHTAVLVATERLYMFLESGIATVSEEERKRRDARSTWWGQGRGEFENVGLLQSLLVRPKRTSGEVVPPEKASAAANPALGDLQGDDDETAQNLTPIVENDDTRSETLITEASTPTTSISTLKGLTARPRHQPINPHHQQEEQQQQQENLSFRLVCTDPLIASTPESEPSNETRLSRTETFGAESRSKQFFSSNSSAPRPRIATSPLPSAVTLQNTTSPQRNATLEKSCERPVSLGLSPEGDHVSAGLFRKDAATTRAFTPGTSPDNRVTSNITLSSQEQEMLSMSSSPGAEAIYTSLTPLESQNTILLTHRALTLPTGRTFQPLNRELDNMIISPEQGAKYVALRVSPIEAKSRVSIAPMIEGPDSAIVSPVDTDSGTVAQPILGVSPITSNATNDRAPPDDADGHVAWLDYMERKRQISLSRWSLRRAKKDVV
ncbi:hypothetical protein N0V93_004218 [Gnomoniopsis smithogilvyi]|uniref:Uncharacterized protein n=1 Tax=Gnomoniopsis smithogilvyi TaxID=1191159 RepID=A0A9W8YQP6_9PEZI|nr:hypothetical protein N0V93_004218 [Gnomoniopsis smithogilvyi]